MRKGDNQVGFPQGLFSASKATIEALSGVPEGAIAYATDTNELGTYDGATWTWGGGGSGVWGGITGTLADQTDLQSALDGKQPVDADLTAIAGITPTNDDVIQRKAGAWVNRTISQLVTDLRAIIDLVFTNISGWNAVSWTSPTRVSASVFTVAVDVTGIIQKGYKLKYTDTTTKYATVQSVTFGAGVSTITIIVNTDYTIVGNPSAIYWSNIEAPFAWPGWFTFTSTVSCSGSMTWTTTTTIGTKYRPFGMNEAEIYIFILGTTGGTASNRIYASLPVTPISPDGTAKLGVTQVNDGWVSTRVGCGYFESTGPRAQMYKADDSNFALSTNRAIFICGSFKY